MIMRKMPAIDEAINQESWLWMSDNLPELAEAIRAEVKSGANGPDIRRHVMQHTQRPRLAVRCEQAAEFVAVMIGQNGNK